MFNNISTDTYIPPHGHISTTPSESTTTFTIEKTANHTEISIMKSQWNLICKKISKIEIKNFTINVYELIIGASIPYIIDVFKAYQSGQQPDYFPIFICLIILGIASIVKKYIPFFNDNSAQNTIHLNDIKDIIDELNINETEHSKIENVAEQTHTD